MSKRGPNTGKQLEARKALAKLVDLMCAFDDEITKAKIVQTVVIQKKGKFNKDGSPAFEPAKPSLLSDIRTGGSLKHLPAIYENIRLIIAERKITESLILTQFENLTQALHPYKRTRLTTDFIKSKIEAAKSRVWIFNTYIPGLNDFAHLLSKRELDVRIVMLSPKSRFLEQRASELSLLNVDVSSFHRSISNNVLNLDSHLVQKNRYKFYSGLPATPMYIFDDDVYCGFFMHDTLAIDSPQRYFDGNTPEGEFILEEFHRIWRLSEPRPDSIFIDPPRPTKVQAFVDLLPGAEAQLDRPRTETIGKEMRGVYQFARYRSSYTKDQDKPIVTGLLQIFPYNELTGTIKFFGKLPNSKSNNLKGMHNFSGVLIPYTDFVFLIGDTSPDNHPIFIGLQRFKNDDPKLNTNPPEGLVLRRHPFGHLLVGRFLLEKRPEATIDHAMQKFDDNSIYLAESKLNIGPNSLSKLLHQEFGGKMTIDIIKLMKHISRN